MFSESRLAHGALAALIALSLAGAATAETPLCTAAVDAPLLPADPAQCDAMEATLRGADPADLATFEPLLQQFFEAWCHRNTASGWKPDKHVRDTGPYAARLVDGGAASGFAWQGKYYGTHAPVVIWYSPDMVSWLEVNRPGQGAAPPVPSAIPDGAMMVKEMYPEPAARCASVDVTRLYPKQSGAAIMIHRPGHSHDGWFWGYFGWTGWAPDWPATGQGLPNMGFGQYCLNCHASAVDYTFSDARNIQGQPGDPLVFLSQTWFLDQFLGGSSAAAGGAASRSPADVPEADNAHEARAENDDVAVPRGVPLAAPNPDMAAVLGPAWAAHPQPPSGIALPSATYDNAFMPPRPAGAAADAPFARGMYVTSDQCVGCHDAGGTGLAFDMTTLSEDHPGKMVNHSPYATWRTSPMGLAGRDPVFFAQLSSETQTFHRGSGPFIETTCLGCHGILGQRQYQIDGLADGGECRDFDESMVLATPMGGGAGAGHARYGALARDGISCTSCHHMVLGEKASAAAARLPQNVCVRKRQQDLNPGLSGFAATFTGSFLVGPQDEIYGQYDDPKTVPMEHALGLRPVGSPAVKQSELCGTCHTVHLPVLDERGATLGRIYEQLTYAEWAFSAYRTGSTIDGPLPLGAGSLPQSCQGCHMPSEENGHSFRSKIAGIQEFDGFPEAEHRLPADAIDLEPRDGFAKHTLVGLNLFMVAMFKQFPATLGIPSADPMLYDAIGVAPLETTERAVHASADASATIDVVGTPVLGADGALTTTVKIASTTGHKLPSGVGFRRAFVTFEVLDPDGAVIWASGRVNGAGLIVGGDGEPVAGELWWDDACTTRINDLDRAHQPHRQVVDSQDQVQIYQELVSTPPPGATAGDCGHDASPRGRLTTSFLSICSEVKDNRLPPPGYLGRDARVEIARALGADAAMGEDAGFTKVGDDPDYAGPTATGGDTLVYRIRGADLAGSTPGRVRATLNYQATPPFYLQDRACTAKGSDRDRLAYLATYLNLQQTRARNWALAIATVEAAVPGAQ